MQIANRIQSPNLTQQDPNIVRGHVQRVGTGRFNTGTATEALRRLKPETQELIRDLNLKHATPRQLNSITARLFWEGAIDIEGEDTLAAMGYDSGIDTPFNVMERLNGHLSYVKNSTSATDWTNTIRIYEKGMELAAGLQEMIRALHPERSIDTYA